jgi:hypothetical protein
MRGQVRARIVAVLVDACNQRIETIVFAFVV